MRVKKRPSQFFCIVQESMSGSVCVVGVSPGPRFVLKKAQHYAFQCVHFCFWQAFLFFLQYATVAGLVVPFFFF